MKLLNFLVPVLQLHDLPIFFWFGIFEAYLFFLSYFLGRFLFVCNLFFLLYSTVCFCEDVQLRYVYTY